MKTGYTHIAILLDRSGSMSGTATDLREGLNTFIAEQRVLEGEVKVTIAQFDHEFEYIYQNFDIKDVSIITDQDYQPRGMTALNDSLARLINETGAYLRGLSEDERPEKVLVQVITDGYENASKEFSHAQVKEMVKEQESKYNWQIVYIGANQDSVLEGSARGITNSVNYVANKVGTKKLFNSLSSSTAMYRSAVGASASFLMSDVDDKEE